MAIRKINSELPIEIKEKKAGERCNKENSQNDEVPYSSLRKYCTVFHF